MYPGGKNAPGTYQTIINQIPPHDIYVEAFLGSGAVMRHKAPAPLANIGIDSDAGAIQALGKPPRHHTFLHTDALKWIAENAYGYKPLNNKKTFLYLDPPYLFSTRRTHRRIYRCELSNDDHRRLLDLIQDLPCMVAISGYWSEMYANALEGWRAIQFQAMTRGGAPATEWLWMNYPEPWELHDYRYLGENFRKREQIKRKKERWRKRLQAMTLLERYAVLDAIESLRPTG
ncbi:MAG: DNA adenine methylase [Chloroflexota bacterium]